MNTKICFFIICLSGGTSFSQIVSGSGSVSGILLDVAGKPIAAGRVSYTRQNEYTRDKNGRLLVTQLGLTAEAIAGSDGSFTIMGLLPGRYQFCGKASQPNQVSDCTWRGVPALDIGPGQKLQGITPRVLDATVLTITVADPNGKITRPDIHGNVSPERRFFIGVVAGSYYIRAERAPDSNGQHVFRVTIPKQQAVHLFLDSDLPVINLAGAALENNKPSSLELNLGALDQITLNLLVK